MIDGKTECLIIAGGKENNIAVHYPAGFDGVFVTACDKGYEYAVKQGIPVDYICGDFDSYKDSMPLQSDVPFGVDVLPTHKDDTDLIHGIKHALELGYKKITLACAGGGRYDHFLSNIQAMVYAREHFAEGGEISLFDEDNEIFVLMNEEKSFTRKEGMSFSVLSFSDKAEGVSIYGTEYQVENVVLTNGFPLGQSNEWKEEKAVVKVEKGILLVIMSKV